MKSLIFLLLGLIVSLKIGLAEDPTTIRVAIHDKPPFAFLDEHGKWRGIGVDLWEIIAKKQGWKYQYVEFANEELIPAITTQKADLIVGELLVNSEDERIVDFSQPFLESKISVAVPLHIWRPTWLHLLLHAFDWTLVRVFLGFIPILLIVSFLIWKLERHRPDGHFGGNTLQGIGSAFWFSAVTMTSTGFGDKVPVTPLGRALAIVWMLISLLLITAFTASVASTVASARTGDMIRLPEDLRHYRNGVLAGSHGAQMLTSYHAPIVPFETYEAGLAALSEGKIDTMIGASVSLQYIISKHYPHSIYLLAHTLYLSRVAFAFPLNSPLRKELNISLLQEIHSPSWSELLKSYLGYIPMGQNTP